MRCPNIELVALLGLVCGVTASPQYPLFAITNKKQLNAEDIRIVANSFRFSDGLDQNKTLLEELRRANKNFKSVKYCNPRGIALNGPTIDPTIIPFHDFEAYHRAEVMYYTGGWLANDMGVNETTVSLDHPLVRMDRNYMHCVLRDWVLVQSNTGEASSTMVMRRGC